MKETMKETYTRQEVIDILSAAIEDRAKWFYLVLKYAKEAGVDVKPIAEKAIFEFGIDKGNKFGPNCKTANELLHKIHSGPAIGAFSMDIIEDGDEKSVMEFLSCPLVEQWKKLGCSDEEIATLCDYASCGDFGLASVSPELNLEFDELLSKGGKCCRMIITKK